MRKRYFLLLIIFLLGLFLRFYRLGEVPVGFQRDEAFLGYNAYSILKTEKDMSGKFSPLHLESFLFSPAGYAYAAIPFIGIFGLNPFSVRAPSALFGALTIIATFFLVKTLFKKWEMRNEKLDNEVGDGILQTSPDTSLRIRTVSIFATRETQLVIDEQIREDGVLNTPVVVARIFHNKAVGYLTQFFQNYFKHFSYDFLFTDQGLPSRYRVPNSGLLYFFEWPLLLLGIWRFLKNKQKEGIFLIGWLVLAPIGSALTFDDVPNLQRTLIGLPALSIVSATGLYTAVVWLENKMKLHGLTPVVSSPPSVERNPPKQKTSIYPWSYDRGLLRRRIKKMYLRYLIFLFSIFYFLFSIFCYLHQYYVHQIRHFPYQRHEGYKDLVQKTNALLNNYKKAIITDAESAPTIFFLFFGKYDPSLFQKEISQVTKTRDLDRISFNKYIFVQDECPGRISGEKDFLYVNHGNCKKIPEAEIDTVKRSDQTEVFQILRLR